MSTSKYDIENPTKANRVIYNGIPKNGKDGAQTAHMIPAGGKKFGIELTDEIADDLMARTKKKGTGDSDLLLTPSQVSDDNINPPKVAAKK